MRTVRILILVDQQILEPPVVIFPYRCHRLEQAHGFEQKIVEVHGIRFQQFLAIFLENVRNLFVLRIRRLQINFLRVEHVILRPGNSREHVSRRQLLVVQAETPHDSLDYLLLVAFVVDNKVLGEPDRLLARNGRGNAQRLNVAPQHSNTK